MAYKKSIQIDASITDIWNAWTNSESAVKWLAPKANISFQPGGVYEFFWGADPEKDSTLGCVLLKIEKENFLSFEWQGNAKFLHMFLPPNGNRTVIEVNFEQQSEGTLVTIHQKETRSHKDWADYEVWMSNAWEMALKALKEYCESRIVEPANYPEEAE